MHQINDAELARRSILGFAELLAAIGRAAAGQAAEVRHVHAVGARLAALGDNPFFNAAIVPFGAAPPADDPLLPYCLWTVAAAAPDRVEDPELAMPCLGLALADHELDLGTATSPDIPPSLAELGDMNERAYGDFGWFSPLVQTLRDERARLHGLRDAGQLVCVALSWAVGDDLSIHYVATEASHRRRGLSSQLVRSILAAARADGYRTATLQASAEGLPVWLALGFRRVATLRGYLRAGAEA